MNIRSAARIRQAIESGRAGLAPAPRRGLLRRAYFRARFSPAGECRHVSSVGICRLPKNHHAFSHLHLPDFDPNTPRSTQ